MHTCRDLTEEVTEYLEHRMGWWQRMMFKLHVTLCPPCRVYLAQVDATIAALGKLPPELPPQRVADELRAKFQEWKRT